MVRLVVRPGEPLVYNHRVSLWSGLWVGDAEEIGERLDDGGEVSLAASARVLAHVDLPGVLPHSGDPGSPERLTAIACEVAGQGSRPELAFEAARGRQLAGDDPDEREASGGAFEMGRPWVDLFAGLDDGAVQCVAQRWAGEWADEAGVPVASVSEITELVTQVRDACRTARDRGAAVVYSWTL
jgi:hypothetical protein